MKIEILTFGQIAEVIGSSGFQIAEVKDIDTLKNKITEMFPEIKTMQFSVAVNKKIIHGNALLNEGDVVALLPPFSGG